MSNNKKANDWAKAKKICRLNQDDIQMAKELGMTPKSLIKNFPSSDQQWKLPVKLWVRELYEEKFGKVITTQVEKSNAKNTKKNKTVTISDEELPF